MKSFSAIIFCFFVASSVFAQQPSDEELKKTGPFIRFEPNEVSLGSIPSNKVTEDLGKIEITVYNDGVKPLIINQVTGCCGTRVEDWSRKPIAPGAKGIIKASFRVATHPHRISRTLTVISNAVNGDSQKISIMGEVIIPQEAKEIKLMENSKY